MIKTAVLTGIIFVLLTSPARQSFAQSGLEPLGLENKQPLSLSIYGGILAVGTAGHGVYWQTTINPSDSGWQFIGLDNALVLTVYAHKSGPVGWGIGAGVQPDPFHPDFIYCSFMGGALTPSDAGINDTLTDRVLGLDGFPDPTICGESYAAGGRVLYRRQYGDTLWHPVYTTSIEGYFFTVKVREEYGGVVLAGGAEGFSGFLLIKSLDYGDSWQDISPPGMVVDVDFAGDSAQTIFASTYSGVFRSLDGGASWQQVFDGQGWYSIFSVIYEPQTSVVYIAGGDGLDTSSAILFYSTDLGTNWINVDLPMFGPILDMDLEGMDKLYFVTPESGVFLLRNVVSELPSQQGETIPAVIRLEPNYPNPFNPQTTIEYYLPRISTVRLEIFNILGQKVCTLVNRTQPAGEYRVTWDGTDENGRQMPGGVYLYRLESEGHSLQRKMLLIR